MRVEKGVWHSNSRDVRLELGLHASVTLRLDTDDDLEIRVKDYRQEALVYLRREDMVRLVEELIELLPENFT